MRLSHSRYQFYLHNFLLQYRPGSFSTSLFPTIHSFAPFRITNPWPPALLPDFVLQLQVQGDYFPQLPRNCVPPIKPRVLYLISVPLPLAIAPLGGRCGTVLVGSASWKLSGPLFLPTLKTPIPKVPRVGPGSLGLMAVPPAHVGVDLGVWHARSWVLTEWWSVPLVDWLRLSGHLCTVSTRVMVDSCGTLPR